MLGKLRQAASSLFPNKLAQAADKSVTQRFMHQFLRTPTSRGDAVPGDRKDLSKTESEKQRGVVDEGVAAVGVDAHQDRAEDETPEPPDRCEITGSRPLTDRSAPLETWMAILGGTVSNVAGTGHCGWLAFYAALANVTSGLMEPSTQVVETATALKRQVVSGLLANLRDEAQLLPQELDAEVNAAEITLPPGATMETKCCALTE
ncbi:hypothetical protein V7S43_009991 [Phytophthora oleae]|uniref:Uncharacterized protein n=1 Tax=Phytophthora oleae TaxID=2107226 RepID=A0ABD3FGL3_9STRA